jgi:hypothetical protein
MEQAVDLPTQCDAAVGDALRAKREVDTDPGDVLGRCALGSSRGWPVAPKIIELIAKPGLVTLHVLLYLLKINVPTRAQTAT